MFPFDEDLEIIANLKTPSDTTRQAFIKEGLETARKSREVEKRRLLKEVNGSTSCVQHCKKVEKASSAYTDSPGPSEAGASVATGPATSHSPLQKESQSAIQSVLGLFPHLGAGFIEVCLRHYNCAEELISALLEDQLPQSLRALDQSMPVAPEEDTLVTSRRNVFDNDEFDVFRRQSADKTKMHRGKRTNEISTPDTRQKDKIKELVSSYDKLALVKQGYSISDFDSGMYDDEYDDTYDANEVGADDADEALELMGRRLVVPVALGGTGFTADEADQEDNSQSSQKNPEPPKYDVTGRAKGHGQTADVTKNRNFKTAHKARGANHNRKAGARSKMSKGMF